MRVRYVLCLPVVLFCLGTASAFADGWAVAGAIEAALEAAPAMIEARRSLRAAELAHELQRASVAPQLGFSPPSGSPGNLSVQFGDTVPSGAVSEVRTTGLIGGASVTLSQVLPGGATVSLSGQNVSTLVLPSEGDPTLQQAAEARVALLQPVFVNGRFIDGRLYPAAEQDVLLGLQDARLALIAAENQTVIAVFRALLTFGTAADEHELATLTLERAESEVRRAELRFGQGSIRFDELLDAEIARDERADEVFSTGVALRTANTEFSLLTGAAFDTGDLRVPREDLSRLVAELRSAQEDTAGDSIDLQRQRTAFERAQLARVLGGATDSGQLQAFFTIRPQYEVGREPDADFTASFVDLYRSSRRPALAAGISLSVPVFDGGATRLRQEQRLLQETAAAHAVEQTAADLDLRRSEAIAERDTAFRRLDRVSVQIRVAQSRVSRAESLLHVGDATEDDVLRAQLDLERRRIEQRRAETDYIAAMLRYLSLQGHRVLTILSFSPQE